ncbi:MAG: transglutaminase domain-containing protein, partial [Ruminococcus sp.]|nr:transglutaminase domain-containing protein [Ruminococcus sp.]
QVQANSILASTGKGVAEIFNYVRDHNKYKYIEDTKSLATIESLGWSSFAQYALNNRYVVCYYFAAITDLLFQQAGYQTRIIYGTGRGDGDHYWNQVVINGQWVNYDTCNGYYGVSDDYLKSQNYTWYKCVYAKFF